MSVDVRAVFQLFHLAKHQFYYQADLKAFGKVEYWIGPDEIRAQLSTQAEVERRDDLGYSWLAVSGYAPGEPWRVVVKEGEHG